MPTREQAEQFETEGYFVADDAVEPGMFDELAAAARRVKHKVRSRQVDVYTHWATAQNTEPWAIRGLLAPEFDEPVFAEYLMSRPAVDYVHHFIGNNLTMGSILIFTNPHHADYSIGWHRDWAKQERDLDYDAEMAVLGKPRTTLRWHLATVDDESLQLVPGSHRRYARRTNGAVCWRPVTTTSPASTASGSRRGRPLSGRATPSTADSTAGTTSG